MVPLRPTPFFAPPQSIGHVMPLATCHLYPPCAVTGLLSGSAAPLGGCNGPSRRSSAQADKSKISLIRFLLYIFSFFFFFFSFYKSKHHRSDHLGSILQWILSLIINEEIIEAPFMGRQCHVNSCKGQSSSKVFVSFWNQWNGLGICFSCLRHCTVS